MLPARVGVGAERERAQHLRRRPARSRPLRPASRRAPPRGRPRGGARAARETAFVVEKSTPTTLAAQAQRLFNDSAYRVLREMRASRRDDVGGLTARHAGLDELDDGGERILLAGVARLGIRARADDERDLALRRLREPRRELRRRSRAPPPRSASSARGRRRPAGPGSAAASDRSVAGSRCGDSNATAGCGQPASSAHSAASAFSPRGR